MMDVLLGTRPPSGLPLIIQAIQEHNPSHVFGLLSGGDDSVTALDVARRHPKFTAAVFVDTGIALPEAEPRTREICERLGVKLLVYRATENTRADGTPDPQFYDELVQEHGFPGPTEIGHGKMFNRLKERQFQRLVRDHKIEKRRIMLITGSRKDESARRTRTVQPTHRDGRTVWVAPLWDWNRKQRDT